MTGAERSDRRNDSRLRRPSIGFPTGITLTRKPGIWSSNRISRQQSYLDRYYRGESVQTTAVVAGVKLTRFGGAFRAFVGGLPMRRTRPPYSPEFRRHMVDLVQAGRDPADLAREFEPSAESIRAWVALATRKESGREEKGDGLSAAERDELGRLRRENKQLRVERDILSRAAAWFARETGAVPSGSSNS